jgi:hypothetical protein
VSANMQEEKIGVGQELICINVDKVYDWIVKEQSFDIFPTGAIAFPGILPTTTLVGATVSCEVTPAALNPIVITNRENRPYCIDGRNVLLQQLNIQKNFDLRIMVTLVGGMVLTSAVIPISRCEQVTLCAPEGTDVAITYTDLDCFVCTPGTLTLDLIGLTITFTGLTISVATCQSIQSTFPVTVEFLAEYCEPRDELPTSCPAPIRPEQCSVVFPSGGNCCH